MTEPKGNKSVVADIASQDLATLESVIERGPATFMEVGTALTAIREGRKYR